MSKKIIVSLSIFVFLLAGCGREELKPKDVVGSKEVSTASDEITKIEFEYYITLISGKYLSTDIYERNSERYNKVVVEALLDVESAKQELNEKFKSGTPGLSDLLNLAGATETALNKLLDGEYATRSEYANKAGQIMGDISRTYLDGELPSIVKTYTGVENTK
ncbi:hypothetical protein [Lederbergia lenta]|uniref:hypothetical protein n=1 Tax=Lederbergia lenta TaxID=1467 RepID=UPI00203D7936|nr:hypothetical protein [Lederbergia lenta]MCM3110639.1 hypothetical protein [Lederbergia lenta]